MVYAGLAYVEEVRPCHVHGAECKLLGDGVDVGGLVDHGRVLAAEYGLYPFGCRLLACDETFGAELRCVSFVPGEAGGARRIDM